MDPKLRKILLLPKTLWGLAIIAMILLVLGLVFTTWTAREHLENSNKRFITEVAVNVGNIVNERLLTSFRELRALASYFSVQERFVTMEQQEQKELLDSFHFRMLYYVLPTGDGISLDGKRVNCKSNAAVVDALKGKEAFFDCHLIHNSNEVVNFMAIVTPIEEDGRIIGALIADLSASWNIDFVSKDKLEKKLLIVVLDRNSNILIRNDSLKLFVLGRSDCSMDALIHDIDQSDIHDDIQAALRSDIPSPKTFRYTVDDVHRDAVIIKLPDFPIYMYVANIRSVDSVEYLTADRTVLSFVGAALLLMIFCSVLLFWFYRRCCELTFVDPVTSGKSSVRFELELMQLMPKLENNNTYAFYSININKFKMFNDFFGRNEGDKVLQFFHNMLVAIFPNNTLICRFGSDEFNLLCQEMDQELALAYISQAAARTTEYTAPLQENKSFYHVTVRVGIFPIANAHPNDLDYLILKDRAGIAKEKACINFNDNVQYAIYNQEDLERVRREKSMENAMHESLNNGDFYIVFQPKVEMETGEVCGAEALVRWRHPRLGEISPVEFIPLFERNGFVKHLDAWVFEEVCRTMQHWQKRGYHLVTVSVNLSRVDVIYDNMLAEKLAAVADNYGIPRHFLEFELTETAFCYAPEVIRKSIDSLRAQGFLCSIDDFGTGYSSLNLLQNLQFDCLKIDRCFFASPNMDKERDKVIIKMIINLAQELGIKIISEGVETIAHKDFLAACGCTIGQGYLFSKPISIYDFEYKAFRKKHRTPS